MPELNGFDAIKKIKEESEHRVPIIAVTALFLEEEKVNIINAGFENIIIKPYIEADILDSIEQYIIS